MLTRKSILAAALLVAGTGAAQAGVISTTFSSGTTTEVANAMTYDFNVGLPIGYYGAGAVLTGSISGISAQPAGDNTPFLSVAYPNQSGTETYVASPGHTYNYFGLYWGSMDDYNSLSFYNGNQLIGTVTGSDVIATGAQLGDQMSAGSNRFVNFFLEGGATFDKIVFSTTNYAFESDNHAFATVPEPGTLALTLAAIGGLFLLRRRRPIDAAPSAA